MLGVGGLLVVGFIPLALLDVDDDVHNDDAVDAESGVVVLTSRRCETVLLVWDRQYKSSPHEFRCVNDGRKRVLGMILCSTDITPPDSDDDELCVVARREPPHGE